jgi:DNA-binding GntR family transcriptional regulator
MRLPLEKLPARTNLVDAVYQLLLDAITDGSLAPGERITQEEIAEQLSISRSPVLQALRLLKQDGFIQDAPGRGVQVAQLDPASVGWLYDVRGALDSLAARLAAQARRAIDPALIERGRSVAQGTSLKAIIDADLAFHNAIYTASGNPLIAQSAHRYWVHLRRVMGAVHRVAAHRATIWDEHAAIAQAIADGDAERAVLLSDQHTRRAKSNLVKQLDQLLGAHPASPGQTAADSEPEH